MGSQQWITVENGLPSIALGEINEDYTRRQVLVFTTQEPKIKIAWFDIEDNVFYDDYDALSSKLKDVIAWQYLPEYYNE